MEEFDLNIVHRPRKQHRNVDGLVRVYEGVGDVLEDDDFLNAMTINVKNVAKEYWKTIQYLAGMKFPIGTTKVMQTRNVHKSQNNLIIGGSTLLLKKGWCFITSHWIGWNLTSFVWISWWVLWKPLCETNHSKFFYRQVTIGPSSSRMPMIITKFVMYVNLMHKGLLLMAFCTPYHLWDLLKMGVNLGGHCRWLGKCIDSLWLPQTTS